MAFAADKYLVVRPRAVLPPRCIVCNAPGDERPIDMGVPLKAGAGAYAGLILGVGRFGKAFDSARAKAPADGITLVVQFCPNHRRVRAMIIRDAAIFCSVVVIFAVLLGLLLGNYVVGLFSFVGGVLLVGLRVKQLERRGDASLQLRTMAGEFAIVEGVGAPFLASLPRAIHASESEDSDSPPPGDL